MIEDAVRAVEVPPGSGKEAFEEMTLKGAVIIQSKDVITSYSIHYTKLYDAVNYIDREIRKDVANHVRETTRYSRITSYNVCYTKLLRNGIRISSGDFLDEIKRELLKDSIYVFTPQGDVVA